MKREKTLQVVVTFHTTAEAMATERICRAQGIPGKLISAPRDLTSDCGIAWASPVENRQTLESALACGKLEVAGFFEMIV